MNNENPVKGYDMVSVNSKTIRVGTYGEDGLAIETHEFDKSEAVRVLMREKSVPKGLIYLAMENLQAERSELIYIIKTTCSKEAIEGLDPLVRRRYGLE